MSKPFVCLALAMAVFACAAPKKEATKSAVQPLPIFEAPKAATDPKVLTDAPTVLITGATVMTGAGKTFAPGYLLMVGGRVAAVGAGSIEAPAGAKIVDARGRYVTPGIIDTHSHIGVYPMPYVQALRDGNEATSPTTPEVWAEHSFWPQDPSIWRAVAGGITTIQVLPGSANLIGGRSFVAKLHPGISARRMRFPNAPQGLKMACGENPKAVYGEERGSAPSTRMGNVAGYRKAFQAAYEHRRALKRYDKELERWKEKQADPDDDDDSTDPPDPPERDLGLDTLVKVLDGEILVHTHCYRADEMHIMLDLAREYGFKIRSFHHALEAYKLADRLAAEGTAVSTWADWWGFKIEAFDGVPQNAALLTRAGARAIIHSDSAEDIRHLNHEAAKAMTAGRSAGIEITEDQALAWITLNAAWALGVDERTGSLEVGKMADAVIWSRHPFSVYALAEKVYIDGHLEFDRADPNGPRKSDFELGLTSLGAQP